MIKRILFEEIPKRKGKAIIVLGPRQTGKTTLLSSIAQGFGEYLLLDCDDILTRNLLEGATTEQIRQVIGNHKTIFIDEAQRVKNIGLTLKIITDRFRDVQLLVSGSSSLELANEINEPLTGRKWEYFLFPISWKELLDHYGYISAMQQLENRILFGMYPDVVTNPGSEKIILKNLVSSYLYKDLLAHSGIRKPEVLERLLQALALQIGNEVSLNELANTLQIDKNTVRNYIDLLEKAYVIFRLNPLSRNLRNEISTNRKVYFYDTGIRNALIANFNPLSLRNDTGSLWENFLVSERLKLISYQQLFVNRFFWRTSQQLEIDYVEEREGQMSIYKFKWSQKTRKSFPQSFLKHYPSRNQEVITRENFNEFLTRTD